MRIIRTDGRNSAVLRALAVAKGYITSEPCGECGNFTLKQEGTVFECRTCGNNQLPSTTTADKHGLDIHTTVPAPDFPAEGNGGC